MSKVHFYRETKFRKTEIGEVPEGWEVKRLKETVKKIKAGGTPKTTVKEYYENGYIPFVKIEDLTQTGKYLTQTTLKITEKGLNSSSAWIVPKNSLLLAMYGSLGEVSINKIEVATNQAILGIIPNEVELNTEFLYYWFLNFKPKWVIYAKTTTQANLTKQIVENIKIPLPPLEEQKAIAKVLKDFDDLIEVIDKKIETYERIKKKLMEIYFTRGVFEHKTFKDTEIGRIPEGWEVKKVSSLLEKAISAHGIKENEIKSKGKYPVVNQGKTFIVGFSDNTDFIINNNLPLVLFGDHTCEVKYIDFPFIVAGEGVKLLKPLESVDVLYFYYVLEKFKPKQEQYRRHFRILKEKLIPLPPLEEQKEIAKRLKAIDDQIENLKKQKEHLQKVKKKFMDLLLTGKLRIKLQ